MSGILLIERIKRLELECNRRGFRMTATRHAYSGRDTLSLVPIDADAHPMYSRDAEAFVGTLEELEVWLRGVAWMDTHYRLLGVVDDAKIAKREEFHRHDRLATAMTKKFIEE